MMALFRLGTRHWGKALVKFWILCQVNFVLLIMKLNIKYYYLNISFFLEYIVYTSGINTHNNQ